MGMRSGRSSPQNSLQGLPDHRHLTAILVQVALVTKAGSLGRVLDCYVASVCAFWESQGPQIAVGSFSDSHYTMKVWAKLAAPLLANFDPTHC